MTKQVDSYIAGKTICVYLFSLKLKILVDYELLIIYIK